MHMDEFFSERALHEARRASRRAIERLDGDVYEPTARCGCAPPRTATTRTACCAARTASWTYFASDIAYHADKLAAATTGDRRLGRRPPRPHDAHARRLGARWAATPRRLELVIMQLVSLTEGGERVQMSKRAGAIVTLDDLVDDIGVDAARWFLAARSHDTTLEIDLELARSESQDNPVYYVQYAHARIASILRKAGEERVAQALAADLRASSETFHPSARALVKRLLELPGEMREAARAARAAPDRPRTPRDGAGVLGLLPRLPGGRGGRGGRRRGRAASRSACSTKRVLAQLARPARRGGAGAM